MPEGEGAEESQGLMSQSESSDEEPDFLWLQPRTAGWMKDRGQKQREGKDRERER